MTVDRKVLLPPYFEEVQAWNDLVSIIDAVLGPTVDLPSEWLAKLRYLYIETTNATAKIDQEQMLVLSDFEVPEKEILIKQAKQLGFDLQDTDLINPADYQNLVRNIALFWYSKGKPNFIDFLGFVLNMQIEMHPLWSTAVVAQQVGDPRYPSGLPAYVAPNGGQGNSAYPSGLPAYSPASGPIYEFVPTWIPSTATYGWQAVGGMQGGPRTILPFGSPLGPDTYPPAPPTNVPTQSGATQRTEGRQYSHPSDPGSGEEIYYDTFYQDWVSYQTGGVEGHYEYTQVQVGWSNPEVGLPQFPNGLPPYAAPSSQVGLPEFPNGLPPYFGGDSSSITYGPFLRQGDPGIGTPVWEGGQWFPTTHVDLVIDAGRFDSPDVNKIINLFYAIANYNLVLRSIDLETSMWIHSINETTLARIAVAYPQVLDDHYALVRQDEDQELVVPQITIPRFQAKFWSSFVGNQDTGSAAITSRDGTFQISASSRTGTRSFGARWSSRDDVSYVTNKYQTDLDYRSSVLSFVLTLGPTVKKLDTSGVIFLRGSSQGITYDYDVHLKYYSAVIGDGVYQVTINFDTVKAGAANNVTIDPSRIEYVDLTLDFIDSSSYIDGTVEVSNISYTGRALIYNNYQRVPENIFTEVVYDRHWNQSPQRLVEELRAQGYSRFLVHIGGKYAAERVITGGQLRIGISNFSSATTFPFRSWLDNLCSTAYEQNAQVIPVGSYRLNADWVDPTWIQRDQQGTPASMNGEAIPSPTVDAATTFVCTLLKEAQVISAVYGSPYSLMEAPYWSKGLSSPALYDAATTVEYQSVSGTTAPFIGNDDTSSSTEKDAYRAFLRTQITNALQICSSTVPGVGLYWDLDRLKALGDRAASFINYVPSLYSSFSRLHLTSFVWNQLGLYNNLTNAITTFKAEMTYTDLRYTGGFTTATKLFSFQDWRQALISLNTVRSLFGTPDKSSWGNWAQLKAGNVTLAQAQNSGMFYPDFFYGTSKVKL